MTAQADAQRLIGAWTVTRSVATSVPFWKAILMHEGFDSFADLIRRRKTEKVVSAQAWDPRAVEALPDELLALAAWAPFHRPADPSHLQDSPAAAIMPWRFYVVDADDCRRLRDELLPTETSKIVQMLATCVALIQATWLPNPPRDAVVGNPTSGDRPAGLDRSATEESAPEGAGPGQANPSAECFAGTLENMEHLAAAGAAVQTFLLAATAAGYRSYWSSGGVLRSEGIFQRLGIPQREILLGSVFVFPGQLPPEAVVLESKLRQKRGPLPGWLTRVRLEP